MNKIAVVFIFYDLKQKKYLIENRTAKQFLANEKLFPGGKVNDDEINNLEKTLNREVKEEIGVEVKEYYDLKQEVKGLGGFMLHPFLVTKWTGVIPDNILDSGGGLEWIDVNDFKPRLKPVKTLLQIANQFVAHY